MYHTVRPMQKIPTILQNSLVIEHLHISRQYSRILRQGIYKLETQKYRWNNNREFLIIIRKTKQTTAKTDRHGKENGRKTKQNNEILLNLFF